MIVFHLKVLSIEGLHMHRYLSVDVVQQWLFKAKMSSIPEEALTQFPVVSKHNKTKCNCKHLEVLCCCHQMFVKAISILLDVRIRNDPEKENTLAESVYCIQESFSVTL